MKPGHGGGWAVRALVLFDLALAIVFLTGPAWWVFGEPDWPLHIHTLAVGLSLIAGGWIAARWRSGRAIARLMLVSAALFLFTFIGYFGLGGAEVGYAIGILTDGFWLAVAANFVVAFPEGRLRSRPEKLVVGAAYVWVAFIRLLPLLGQPDAWGCSDCPRNILQIGSWPELIPVLVTLDKFVPALITIAVFSLVLSRWARATRPERRVLAPVFLALGLNVGAAFLMAVASSAVQSALISEPEYVAAVVIQRTAILLLPFSFAFGILRGVLARSSAANLLVRVGRGSTVGEIERDVAWALADPSARLAIRSRGERAYLSTTGHVLDVESLNPDAVTMIGDDDLTAAALIHDPTLTRDQPELLEACVSAIRLALDNHHLQAAVKLERELPVGLAERLQRDGARIGDTRTIEISVLMSDIRGYTAIAEQADLHQLAGQLNEHRAAMTRVITDAGGTVMQFVGDMVFAVFGAPVATADHASRATSAALAMQRAQADINELWQGTGRPAFGLGIAVTTGEVAAALLGSTEHVEYSVVGDVVNLAQRLQGLAKAGEVIVSDATFAQLADRMRAVELPATSVKGRRSPVKAYRMATGTA